VRGARIAMLAETTREVLLIAPGDERIDQPIAPPVREVVVPEAEAPPFVKVGSIEWFRPTIELFVGRRRPWVAPVPGAQQLEGNPPI
jgi:hypothetical protein